jgi:hypothetical protein
LDVGRPEEFGRGGVVVNDGNRQDFTRHHLSHVLLRLFVLKDLRELRYSVIVLISELPPVGANLRNLGQIVLFNALAELAEFFVN